MAAPDLGERRGASRATAGHLPGEQAAGSRRRTVLRRITPELTHVVSLVLALVVLAYLSRRQWFYADEFEILNPTGPRAFMPHSGHLIVLPTLAFRGLRAVFGLRTYLPYIAGVLVVHVLLVHLLWRVMLRCRVEPWIATALAALLLLFGTGSVDIFWAFQAGYLGAVCAGVAVMLLVTREDLELVGCVGAALVTAVALGCAGTSLPVVALAVVLSLRFRGLRTTAAIFTVPIALYLLWYVAKPSGDVVIATPPTLRDFLTWVPRYVGVMFGDGFSDAIPLPGAGAILVAALLAWMGARSSQLGRVEHALPAALLASAVVFGALTAYSRYGIGIGQATSSRYLYVVFALCLPAIGAGATALSRRGIMHPAVAVGLILGVGAYNAGLLLAGAHAQAGIEQGTRRQVYAALAFVLAHPGQANQTAAVDPKWAPALTPSQLLAMHERGWINVGHHTRADTLDALLSIATQVRTLPDGPSCAGAAAGPARSATGAPLVVNTAHSGPLDVVVLGSGGLRSRALTLFAHPGQHYEVVNHTGRRVAVASAPEGTTYCPAG